MQLATLLPPSAVHTNGRRRSPRIVDADDPGALGFQVEATRFIAGPNEEEVLRITAWAPDVWAVVGLDGWGVLRATAWSRKEGEALDRWEQLMAMFGLDPLTGAYTLLPPKDSHGGPRRSSLLIDADHVADAGHQVSAKRITIRKGSLLQIRVCMSACGWTQIVFDEQLGLAAFAAADTETRSWKAARAGLRIRGYGV